MPIRVAFLGFRHAHIMELYTLAQEHPDVQLVAAAEDHAPTRQRLTDAGKVRFTHDSADALFAEGAFDALAVGDYYGRRGELLIRALEAGKHVIADKPICTSASELQRITQVSQSRGLSVGCQLTLRDLGNYRTLRQVVRSGRIGDVHTITFLGQHPLARQTRAPWYFEPGKHGGTINDIAIHGIDAVPWITTRRITEIVAARTWNGGLTQPADFQVGAQFMLRLDNGGGVLADVSYLAPEKCGYTTPNYWRFTIHGTGGQAETSYGDSGVTVYEHASEKPDHVPAEATQVGSYFQSFLAEIQGRKADISLSTAQVLEASRIALLAQQCADTNLRAVPC